ncbi:MAG: pentapeptide repeat-containing protein, partial [Pseudomonadota bacterium]
MLRALLPMALAVLALFAALPALAEQGKNVGWEPVYSPSCNGCNLSFKRLAGWNLDKGQFEGANFTASDLRSVSAEEANFTGATFTGTNLIEANLARASVEDASLNAAKLQGASATGLNAIGASLIGANLTAG